MSDANDRWAVSFSRTSFLLRVLSKHENVINLRRERDILFSFTRAQQGDEMHLLGADEYVFGLSTVMAALDDFGPLQFITIGGNWNKYSPQAKEYCLENRIGIYNFNELAGGIWSDKYWDYAKKNEDGDRILNPS